MSEPQLRKFLKNKKQTKKNFTEAVQLDPQKALIVIIHDGDLNKKEQKTVDQIITACNYLDTQLVILSDKKTSSKRTDKIIELPYSERNRHTAIEAADMALSFNFSDIEEMHLRGTIPISQMRPGVENYNPNDESGNSFIYQTTNEWAIFAAMVRALETYKFPYDWMNIVRQGLKKSQKY